MKDLSPSRQTSKFADPFITADGQTRAHVALTNPQSIWFNTGTLCNITCTNCYIESSPKNDALVYMTGEEVQDYLDEIIALGWPVTEIGLTGGEPFMNPHVINIIERSLCAGFEVLVLTNAMRPMMRPKFKEGLIRLGREYPGKMTFRISIDHYSEVLHDEIRGRGAFRRAVEGMQWLSQNGFQMAVAGRTKWGEGDAEGREGYASFFQEYGFDIDPWNPAQTVLFPEMDETVDVPEITTACWDILGKTPDSVMCASSRMVVKRKGAEKPAVLACTLLAYDEQFELGQTLAESDCSVQLNHPHCAKFCILGGASCSA